MEKIGDLIELPVVETVIKLQNVRDSQGDANFAYLQGLAQSFILTEDIEVDLKVVLDAIMRKQGKGFFLSGSYGSGKSHFLSMINFLLQYEWSWQSIIEQNPKMGVYKNTLSAKKYLIVLVPLLAYKSSRPLEEIVFEAIQSTLETNQYKIEKSLTEESYFLEQFQKYLLPLHRIPLEKLINHEFPAINTYERLVYQDKHAAFVIVKKYLAGMDEKIPFQLTPDRQQGFNALDDILKNYKMDGIVLLIDELSEFLKAKQEDRALNEDARFLQYLGERSENRPIWVIASLQEHIEKTGNIQESVINKIKDRYNTRLELSTEHIKELINHRLILKKPNSKSFIEKAFLKLKYSFNDIPITLDAFVEIYPVHPETIELLDTCADLFSQKRGVVDFIHFEVKGDPSRNIKGILEENMTCLLTPDRIFDHFQSRFKESPGLRKYYELFNDYFKKQIPRIFKDDENDIEYALRLIKILILLKISPIKYQRSVKQLANMLLYTAFEDLAGIVNYEYIEGRLVKKLIANSGYLKLSPAKNPMDAILEIDIEETATAKLIEQVREIIKKTNKETMIDALISQIHSSYFPFAMFIKEPYHFKNINWANSGREGIVWLSDLSKMDVRKINQWIKTIQTTENDFALLIARPVKTEEQRQQIKDIINQMDNRFANGIIFWLPKEFTSYEALQYWYAYQIIIDENQHKQTKEGIELKRLAETKLEEVKRSVWESMIECYKSGDFLFYQTEFPFNFSLSEFKNFEDILSLIIRQPLEKLYPQHMNIQTRMPVNVLTSINELIEKFMIPGSVESIDAPYHNYLKNLIEGIAMPLHIAKFKGQHHHTAYFALNPEKSVGCKAILDYLHKRKSSREASSD